MRPQAANHTPRPTQPEPAAPGAAPALAARVGQALYAADACTRQTLGMRLISCEPGRAQLSLTVRVEHLNGLQSCHGGVIFSLADSAFGYACNSGNQITVGAACSIEYLRPARVGDVLTADAQEQYRGGRSGVYDVRVRNQHGHTIALFRGKSAQLGGAVLPPDEAA